MAVKSAAEHEAEIFSALDQRPEFDREGVVDNDTHRGDILAVFNLAQLREINERIIEAQGTLVAILEKLPPKGPPGD